MKELIFLERKNKKGKDIKYIISKKECWECSSHKGVKDYPVARIEGVQMYLNRYSYSKYKGAIPDGFLIRHTCDNPSCINPEHLILGTHKDNMLDKKERNRCNSPKGIKQSASKLSEIQVVSIRKEEGSYRELAKKYNVSFRTIGDIKKRILWKHI